ncbi:MAG: Ig-like domain-containing protein [Bacteroidales bacterium]
MKKTITLIFLSLFIAATTFGQLNKLSGSKNYRGIKQSKQSNIFSKELRQKLIKEVIEEEGFEGFTEEWPEGWETASSSDLSGADWTSTDFAEGDNTWFINTPESFEGDGGEYIYEGERSAAIGYTAGQEGNPMHWLVSKEMEIPSEEAVLSFMTWFECNSDDGWYTYFHVQIEVDGEWENLMSWDADSEEYVNHWEEPVEIDLSDYSGETVKFGFVYEYNDGYQMALDNIALIKPEPPAANDAGISKILSPESNLYEEGEQEIEVILQNYGADTLKNVDVNVEISQGDETIAESTEEWTGKLAENERDTLVVTSYNFDNPGEHTIKAYTASPNGEEDINPENNEASVSIEIFVAEQLKEDFEEGEFVNGWENDELWEVSDVFPYSGSYHSIIDHNMYDSEAKMITPKVQIDGSVNTLSFYAIGGYNQEGMGSSKLQIMYSTDKENWEEVGQEIDFAEEDESAYEKYEIDLDIPQGEYYLAFSAISDFYYIDPDVGSIIAIDNILGPFLAGPDVASLSPENEATGVPVDELLEVEFNQEVDSVDFSEITIEGDESGTVENITASLEGKKILIDHDPFINHEEYTVTIPEGAVENVSTVNEEISWTFTSIMEAPETKTLSPENESEGVVLDADVSAIFDQKISDNNLASVTMTGNVQGDVTGVDATVHSDGKTVVIEHDDFTEYEDTITVNIPADAVVNEDGVGNENEIEWEFYTMNEDQPVADSLAPANNATGVALDADALIRFDKTVTANDLNGITITGENEGEVGNVEANLEDDDMTITITHDDLANNDELYTVTIPGGAVEASGEPNDEIKWNFTSIKTAPQLVEMVPADGENKVAPDEEINFSFDQEVDTDYDLDTMITIIGENEDTTEITSVTQDADEMGYTIAHNGMEYNNAEYTVTVPAELVYNSDEVLNEDEVSWTFTTIMAKPEAVETTPEENEIDVALDADVSMVFSQEVTEHDLSAVQINSEANGKVENVNATLGDDNKTVTIEHDRFFDTNDDTYTVIIPARSVYNNDEVYNEGISWSFKTIESHDVTFLVKSGNDSIEDVSIEFGGMTEATDTNGIALFNGVEIGENIQYKAYKENYDTLQGSIDVFEPITLILTMEEAYTVTFNVSDGSSAIEDAEVTFNSETIYTDSNGEATFNNVNPEENMSYLASKDQHESVYGTISVTDNITKDIILEPIASNVNQLEKLGIKVYPVPANEHLNIDNIKGTTTNKVEIIDVNGKMVLSQMLNDVNNNIDISGLNEGIYFLRIHLEEEVVNTRIIIE